MPIPLSTEQREALSRGALAIRVLIDFYLDSGRYSFWDGAENWTYDATSYLAASDIIDISEVRKGLDLGAEGMEIRLNGTRLVDGVPDDALDPGYLFGTIETENYQQRRVNVKLAFFDAESYALLFVVDHFAGLIDQMKQIESVDDDGTIEQWLVCSVESVARRYGVRNGRTRSHEDQQEIYPGDTFFKYTAPSAAQQGGVWWGRKPPGTSGLVGLPGGFVIPGTKPTISKT